MRTWDFHGLGVPPWMDPDVPWLDECAAADAAQDAAALAAEAALDAAAAVVAQYAGLMAERYGDPAQLAAEVGVGEVTPAPAEPPARWVAADPRSLVDHDLICRDRRRRLAVAFADLPDYQTAVA